MPQLPEIRNYGDYSSDNYGAHTLRVDLGEIELWYSYQTIVAYRDAQDGLTISENIWGTTTGKHLNWINSDHSRRLDHSEFSKKLAAALQRHIV